MFWNLVIGLVSAVGSFAINLILGPKPQNAKPASVDDFTVPTADESRELPWLFGTKELTGPNVHWWGHLKADDIYGGRRYGLFGPRQTIGHNYFLGMHMILCHGVADAVYRIKAGDNDLWKGICKGGRIAVKGKAGGNAGTIYGDVDIEMGAPNQGQNSYLKDRLGADVPAFRGVVGAVLRRPNMGETPYLAPWSFTTQRVFKKWDGSPVWYSAKAGIGEVKVENAAVYIALDVSGSMAGARLANMKAAVIGTLQMLRDSGAVKLDVRMVAWSTTVATSIERRNVTNTGYNDLIAWVNGLSAAGDTSFEAAVSQASSFFAGSGTKRRIFIFVTDGLPTVGSADTAAATLMAISNVEAYAFNIDLPDISETRKLDNTPDDGVPVVSGGDPKPLRDALSFAFSANVDMNPAHIIRECVTDPVKGMGYKESDMGPSWVAAADTLYNEGFGLTLLWQREEEISEFAQMVQSHIDAYVYVDRRTGKFEIKLIRNDYDLDAIPVVTDEDIISVEEVRRRQPAEAVTSVAVKYFDRKQGKDGIYVAHNPAQVQLSEGTVPITRHYPGVQTMELASRLAERDLHALGSGFADGNITVKRTLSGLNPGDPFRLFSERLGFSGEVMRVTEIKLGDGRSNAVRLKFVQDVFGIDADPLIIDEGSEWENPSSEPAPVERRLVHEMPYREMVQAVGEASAGTQLAANPDAGLVQFAGGRPTDDSIQAVVAIDDGTGYEDLGERLRFAPSALVNGALEALETSLTVRGATDLDLVAVGSLASIGDEIVRVDAIAGNTLTIGRGCLDTVPQAHADGAPVVFFDDFSDSDVVERSAGDLISVKLKTETGRGELDEAEAPTDTVMFASRAIRPYRNAKIEPAGPVDATGLSIIPVTWARRNRLTEAAPLAWTDPDQTPEAGQTTTLTLTDPAGVVVHAYTGIAGTSHAVSKADFGELGQGYIVVSSERDGRVAWRSYSIPVILATPGPSDILIDNDTVSVSATTGTVVGKLSTVGGMAPITFEIID